MLPLYRGDAEPRKSRPTGSRLETTGDAGARGQFGLPSVDEPFGGVERPRERSDDAFAATYRRLLDLI